MGDERFEGVKVRLGDRDYIIPPLNLGSIKRLREDINVLSAVRVGEMMTDEQIDSAVRIFHAALSRNYPDITIEEVEEAVDLGNIATVTKAMMKASGFDSGETQAGDGRTGTESMPT